MYRALVIFAVFGLVCAGPAVIRKRKDIEAFKEFLDGFRKDVGKGERFQSKQKTYPMATAEEMSGKYQGDIILDDVDVDEMVQDYSIGRSAYRTSSITSWPQNTVIFEFGNGEFNDAQKEAIWVAIRDIEAHTCVKFRLRTSSDPVYVKLTGEPSGCYSHIGYRVSRGAHQLNLARNNVGSGCFRHATIVHEWMHILGFLHMHATYDRDQYVVINQKNIAPGNEHNFDLYGQNRIVDLGVEYDYVSCMHYGPYSFSANGAPTITPLRRNADNMGQREYVTNKDWLRINRYYNCPGAWN